jgi:hypothetical protein
MNERLRQFLGKFIDLRSPQEKEAAFRRVLEQEVKLREQRRNGEITPEEYFYELEILEQNPDYRSDLKRTTQRPKSPQP